MTRTIGTGLRDVLVVGAGPVGSCIAHRLAGSGRSVLVVEEHSSIGEPMQCTGIVGAECVQRFPLFDDSIVREVNSARLFSPSGREIRLWREDTQAYIIDRTSFDRSLAGKAQALGAEYATGCRAKQVELLNDRVRLETDGGREYAARAIVIASGFYSRLPQQLGLGRAGDFMVGAQAEVNTDSLSELEIYFDQDTAPGIFAWLVPTTPNRALAGLFCRKNPISRLRSLMSELSRKGRIDPTDAKITPGGIPLRPLRKTYLERVLVAGDAAGQVKPTTGGGVYYGLLCADIAADVLLQALEAGDYSEKHLSRYQKRWKGEIGRELRVGYIARRIYEKRTNSQIDRLFNILQSKGIIESLQASPDISFDWHSRAIVKALQHIGPWSPIFARGGKN